MITFEEFDEAIANVAIDAVFPTKRDLYMKPVYSHDNKDDKIGMTYVIMPYESKNYYIGFIHEQSSSMFTMWNGKLNHIVFDVDERDGCIRYYHEPELYDRDHGLSHSQIQTIGEALIKYLTSNNEEKDDNEPEETKKKHPLQNSPTFPEEESAECEVTCEQEHQVVIHSEKELPPFVKTRCILGFDTDALKIGHPYRVTSERYGEQIMFLNRASDTLLHFFKLIVYDGEVQRQEEYLVSIDNVVNDGYIIQEMK